MLSGRQSLTALLLVFGLLLPGTGTARAQEGDDRQQIGDRQQSDDRQQIGDRQQSDDRQQTGDRQQSNDRQQVSGPQPSDDRQQTGDRRPKAKAGQPSGGQDIDIAIVSDDRQQADDRQQIEDRQQSNDRQQSGDLPQPGRSRPAKGKDQAPSSEPSFDDINQGIPDAGQKGGTDQSPVVKGGGTLPVPADRHGPPGRGPRGDVKWELVDGSNQDGSDAAREALAREIYGTGIGFSRRDLINSTRAELVDILMWLDDTAKREKDFSENWDRSAKKIERQKLDMSQMSLGDLYKVRVGGWFDHQKDADDMRVAMDFKRFLQDRANRPNAEPGNIYRLLLQDIDHLIILAGPAYNVSISKDEIRSVKKVEAKFQDGKHKGVFQFAASYVMGLMLDKNALKAAIASKNYARRPTPGKGRSDTDYSSAPWEQSNDFFGSQPNRGKGSDIDMGGGKPRSPGFDDGTGFNNGGDPRNGDPNDRMLRGVFRDTAQVGTQILNANDRYNRQMDGIQKDYNAQLAAMNGPAAPSSNPQQDAAIQRAISDSDTMLDQIRERQRTVVNLITQWRSAQDVPTQRSLESNIRGLVYGGSNPSQPSPDSILGMLNSPRLRQALGYANQGAQSGNPAFQSAASRIFGAGGKLDRIQRTQHEVVGQYLRDRDGERRGKADPNNPNGQYAIGPNGLPVNSNGQPVDANGQPLFGPNGQPQYGPNGQPLNQNGPQNGPGAPASGSAVSGVTGNPLPGGGNQQIATDPNQRLAQINNALRDPNITPQERANLQAEQARVQQQLTAQNQAAAAAAAAAQNAAAANAAAAAAPRAPVSGADAAAQAKAQMPNVPNSYGVAPGVLTDAELQAAAQPAIQAEVAKMNDQLKSKGMTVNEYFEYSGKGVQSTGRPSGDRYQLWCQRVPAVKAAMQQAAQAAYASKLAALQAQIQAQAPAPAPAPVQNPAAVATPLPSQVGAGPAGAIVEPR